MSNTNATGFQPTQVDTNADAELPAKLTSTLSDEEAIDSTQLIELDGNEGSIIFHPKTKDFDIGDVLYLRDRIQSSTSQNKSCEKEQENGLIVQIISKGIANYPQADSKALFRLLTSTYKREYKRSYNEPKEVIDEFLIAEFIVRASIQDGQWKESEGKVVTRNVDIFLIKPSFLVENVVLPHLELSLNLGNYKKHPIRVYAGGFEKVNLITGMKGGGKSHITKGIIHLQRKLGMPSIVFDINGEYSSLPKVRLLVPGENLKFRIDQLPIASLFRVFDKFSLFNTPATDNAVRANLPDVIKDCKGCNEMPDLDFLFKKSVDIVGSQDMMIGAYERGIKNLISYNLFCTSKEALKEDEILRTAKDNRTPQEDLSVSSLKSIFYRMVHKIDDETNPTCQNHEKLQSLEDLKANAEVVVFDIAGLVPTVRKVVVSLIIDQLKEICHKQSKAYQAERVEIPIYPCVFFEEAQMYMDTDYIDELIPLIRHLGMNLFFITNTPGALPDSVFRLVDNLIMSRMINKKDIDKVVDCGLADRKTIEGFARDLKEYHSLFLSARKKATNNFPLVFNVRDFTADQPDGEGLKESGVTRSMWQVINDHSKTT